MSAEPQSRLAGLQMVDPQDSDDPWTRTGVPVMPTTIATSMISNTTPAVTVRPSDWKIAPIVPPRLLFAQLLELAAI